MLKKPFNQLFNGNMKIARKLNIDLNLRPQNLNFETYYKLVKEYENLSTKKYSYFDAYGLPTTIIFDKSGKEIFRTSGMKKNQFTSKSFIRKIKKLL